MRNIIIGVVLVYAIIVGVGSLFSDEEKQQETTEQVSTDELLEESESAIERDNPLDAIDLSAEEKRQLNDEVEAALLEAYSEGGVAAEADSEEARVIEDEIIGGIADKYGVTLDEAKTIYTMSTFGYLYDVDPETITVPYGDVLDATINGTTLVLKVKISSSLTDSMTINQNYYNVENIIVNQGLDEFSTISYWAVADMTDGSEGKVISFSLGKDLIEAVAAQSILPNQLGDYVENLWLLPSLTQG